MEQESFMDSSIQIGLLVCFIGIVWLLILYANDRRRAANKLFEPAERTMSAAKITELSNTVATLLVELTEARHEIENLKLQLSRANARITELEIMYEFPAIQGGRGTLHHRLLRPLLVIGGDDNKLAGMDQKVLDDIGIRYVRLTNATREAIVNELTSVRRENRLYEWVLISAHANHNGVRLFSDTEPNKSEIAPPEFWSHALTGVSMVGLAACSGSQLAEKISCAVEFVWYFKEDVPSEPASKFVQKFFQRLNAGDSYKTAFVSSLDAVPEVASYADYRCKYGC